MTKLVNTIKEVHKASVQHMKKPGNLSRGIRHQKDIIEKWQRFDPGSKYFGITGIPGVESGKEKKDDWKKQKEANEEAARKAAEEAAKPKPVPIQGDEELSRRRAYARKRRSSGRLSTVLSPQEGLG